MSRVALHVALLLTAAACSDNLPMQQGDESGTVLVSAPVPRAALSSPHDPGAGAGTVGFVSAVPGTWLGDHAVISNARTGESRSVPLTAGGFDPVALAAAVGDTLSVTVSGTGNPATAPIKREAAPRVVRTEPTTSRTDVPLNSVIIIVFTGPISLPSAETGIRLFDGGTAVAVTLTVDASNPAIILLQPLSALQPNTAYHVDIAASVQDLVGNQMGSAVSVAFTTGGNASSVTQIVLSTPSVPVAIGAPVTMSATPFGASGPVSAACAWSSSAPAIAPVTPDGRLTAVAPGTTTVSATCAGVDSQATVTVVPNPLGSKAVVFVVPDGSRRSRWYRLDGSGSPATLIREAEAQESNLLLSPDGGRIAFTNNGKFAGGLYVMNSDGTGAIRLVPDAGGQLGVPFAWSNDGARVYFLAAGAFVVPAAGGKPTPIAGVPPSATEIALSPDERNLVFVTDTAQSLGSPYFYDHTNVLQVAPTDGGPARILVAADSIIPFPFGPSWSPDGRWIAFSGGVCDLGPVVANLYMVEPDGSNLTKLISNAPGTACDGPPVWSPDGTQLAVPTHNPGGPGPAGIMRLSILDVATHGITGGFSTTWYVPATRWAPDGGALISQVFDGGGEGSLSLDLYLSLPSGAAPVLLGAPVDGMAFVR